MLLYITGGVGFVLSIAAIVLIIIFHIKAKSKILPIILYVLGFILFLGSGFMHFTGFPSDESGDAAEPLNLTGEWKQTNSESENSYQGIYITNDAIEVYWVSDNTSVLYWAGSFTPPEDDPREYVWESENDTGRTSASLLGSGDATMEFTYKKGKLTYTASLMGVTTKIEAEPQDWGYTPAASAPAIPGAADSGDDAAAPADMAPVEPDVPADPGPADLSAEATPTAGEQNALAAARNYLSALSFSYDSLVSQLEFSGYSNGEAVYGADNCGADWNEQAANAAQFYLASKTYTRDALIEQLELVGFTHDQAVYGAEQNGY